MCRGLQLFSIQFGSLCFSHADGVVLRSAMQSLLWPRTVGVCCRSRCPIELIKMRPRKRTSCFLALLACLLACLHLCTCTLRQSHPTSPTWANALPQHCLEDAGPTAPKETLSLRQEFKERFTYDAEDDVELILKMGRIQEKQHSALVTHTPMLSKRVHIKLLLRYKP